MLGKPVGNFPVAQGSTRIENPLAPPGGEPLINYYGYIDNGPMLPALGSIIEATKTEPDKNTYLVLKNQHGKDAAYDYGSHVLYQGHENGKNGHAGLTRINLDADDDHRVTLLAVADKNGAAIPTIDGSMWDPFAKVLLFTSEAATTGGVWQATPDWPSVATPLTGIIGNGGYEGIQADSSGELWIVEDVGGSAVSNARRPNSFVYRFVPKDKTDLTKGGKLQALQVISNATGNPIVFQAGPLLTDFQTADYAALHAYGNSFATNWVLLHDTDVDGTAPFAANTLAKAKSATPFKRPENGQFRPGSKFREFFFTETGDTNSTTAAGGTYGGFTALFKVSQTKPDANSGTLTLLYNSPNTDRTGFDNLAFLTDRLLLVVEDAGDGLHTQKGTLDSMWLFDVTLDYSLVTSVPVLMMAEGRDASATVDSALLGLPGFQNDGDNEITGIHVSDGDPDVEGLLGAKKPEPFGGNGKWRIFWTQQHGDNTTYEIIERDAGDDEPGNGKKDD
jgi:hypothetical protein